MQKVSTKDIRSSLGEIFDRVRFTGKGVVVERKGEELVAIVPVALAQWAQQQKLNALNELNELLDQARCVNEPMSDEMAMEKANKAVQSIRKRRKK